ncbi:MAG: response regulator [Bacteriovoracia bacterium]
MENRLHCEVVTVGSVSEALEHINHTRFDVIVSDYEMPIRSGMDLAAELSARNCETPFLIYTAHSVSKHVLRNLNLVVDVVQKPHIEDLFSIISTLMDWPLEVQVYHRAKDSRHQ